MAIVQEAFVPKPFTASGVLCAGSGSIGGILCTVSGTVSVYDNTAASGSPFVNALAMQAGVFYPMPASVSTGVYITASGGAAGTLFGF